MSEAKVLCRNPEQSEGPLLELRCSMPSVSTLFHDISALRDQNINLLEHLLHASAHFFALFA
jgi:hypothetical protein